MKSMQGKVALITGAGKGAGRRAAQLFSAEGAKVAAADLTPVNLDETIASVIASGGIIKPFLVDIARKLPVQGLLNQVLDEWHKLDILVNCAEVEPQRSLLEMDEWEWSRTIDVNLTGAFLLTQSAGRIMKERGEGIIIHVSEQVITTEGKCAYRVSKLGIEKLVHCAAEEFQQWHTRVLLAHSAEEALELCRS